MDKNTEATDRASIDYHYFVRGRLPEWETHIEEFSAQSAEVVPCKQRCGTNPGRDVY